MFPSPIGELHFSILVQKTLFVLLHRFRPLSGSYISQFFDTGFIAIITPPFPSPIGELHFSITKRELINITDKQFPSPIGELHFSMVKRSLTLSTKQRFPSPIGELHFSICSTVLMLKNLILFPSPIGELHFSMNMQIHVICPMPNCFRPLSGSYISQYHPRNPMSCLGRIGGLRGKSNFIEIQPFWKVKSSHKSSI